MIRNKTLDFIIETIQWGHVKAGDFFYSEKELSIKLNVSTSTAKNTLNFAESIGLIKSRKGLKRIVLDFSNKVFLSKYLTINSKEMEIIKTNKYSKEDKEFFGKKFTFKIIFSLKLEFIKDNKKIATFYSSTPNKNLHASFLNDQGTFLDFLKHNKIIIENIEKDVFYYQNKILINRKLFGKNNNLLEEGLLVINPKYFLYKSTINFFYSKN